MFVVLADQILEFSIEHCNTQILNSVFVLGLPVKDAEVAEGIKQYFLFITMHAVLLNECEACVLPFGDLLLHILDHKLDIASELINYSLVLSCGEPA